MIRAVPLGLAAALLLSGCTGQRTPGERAARRDLSQIGESYRPPGRKPDLPAIKTNSPLNEFLLYAVLNQPQVEAAYYDWAAAVQRITVERSRPDPRLTFSADIADVVMSLIAGLMIDLPGPGKLRAAANVATAESEVLYFEFHRTVLQAAYNLKRAYYQLYFLNQRIAINRETLSLLEDLEKIARAQNETAKVTLQDVLRAQIEKERLGTEIENLEDSRNPLAAQFKAALGLKPREANPPIPAAFESSTIQTAPDELLTVALARNPRLRRMEAEIRQADAAIRVAQRGRVPDFNLGLDVDVKAPPFMSSPQAGITLPIWRDKITAQIAAAQAQRQAAGARLSGEEIAVAVEFAERSFTLRESERNLRLLEQSLLPKAKNSLEVGRSGYTSGRANFIDLIDAERTLLEFQLAEVQARTERELALAELSLLIVGEAPAGAPLLTNTNGKKRSERRIEDAPAKTKDTR